MLNGEVSEVLFALKEIFFLNLSAFEKLTGLDNLEHDSA